MRDPSSYPYTVVVFLEKRVSYVTAIIQSAFGHMPESHKDGAEVESCGTNFARLRPSPSKRGTVPI